VSPKALLYILAIPEFAPSDAQRLRSLRQSHCPPDQHGLNAHVTLMFAVPECATTAVCSAASECAQRYAAFELILTEVVSEQAPPDTLHYLFAQPGPVGGLELQALHDDLYRTLSEAQAYLLKPFKPHVTIGIFEDQVKCEEVLREVQCDQWDVRSRVHSLTVIRWTGVLDKIVAEYELLP